MSDKNTVMDNTYVIAWKSRTEPRWGQGKKLFTREEAEALADELNQDYPNFTHEALNLAPAARETTPTSFEEFPAPAPGVIVEFPLAEALAV